MHRKGREEALSTASQRRAEQELGEQGKGDICITMRSPEVALVQAPSGSQQLLPQFGLELQARAPLGAAGVHQAQPGNRAPFGISGIRGDTPILPTEGLGEQRHPRGLTAGPGRVDKGSTVPHIRPHPQVKGPGKARPEL